MPPIRIRATRTVMIMPIMRFTVEVLLLSIMLKLRRAVFIEETIVFTCVAFPVPKTVRTPKIENTYASHLQFLLRPFLI